MGMLRVCILALLFAYVGHRVYHVVTPQGVPQPYLTKIIMVGNQLLFKLCRTLDYVGVAPDYQIRRFYVNSATQIKEYQVPGIQKRDDVFAGVPVRIYAPDDSPVGGPAIVFYHGGGWIIGSIEAYETMVLPMVAMSNITIISVQYRLNPEHTHNEGLDDCVAATKYILQHAEEYGFDSSRIAIAGDSAGGNYAAVVALRLRDDHVVPMPKLQLLIYPSVQSLDFALPSFQQNAHGPFITLRDMCWAKSYLFFRTNKHVDDFESHFHVPSEIRHKMGGSLLNHDHLPDSNKYKPYQMPDYDESTSEVWPEVAERLLDPYHYPIMADTHSHLPEAYIFTAQYDILRDDGYLYAHTLRDDGVKVTHYNCHNCWHGMFNFATILDHPMEVLGTIMKSVKARL